MADPAFELPATLTNPPRRRAFESSALSFQRLEGTRREGEQVAALIEGALLVGDDALERSLKTRQSPRILHIASHGFFLPQVVAEVNEPGLVRPLPLDPLLRSGLVPAGAQTWCEGWSPPPEAEDGLLLAEDVSTLDLMDTELVVLSACETALGEVQQGEECMACGVRSNSQARAPLS